MQLYINYVDFDKAFNRIHLQKEQQLQVQGGKQQIQLGVRQGCPMSVLLFNLMIDWVMRPTTSNPFKDLDFPDNQVLVSHTHQHMQDKTTHLSMFAQQVGPKISQKKTEVMTLNVSNPLPVKVFQQPKNSPTSVAMSGMTGKQAVTSGITSTRPGMPSEY